MLDELVCESVCVCVFVCVFVKGKVPCPHDYAFGCARWKNKILILSRFTNETRFPGSDKN